MKGYTTEQIVRNASYAEVLHHDGWEVTTAYVNEWETPAIAKAVLAYLKKHENEYVSRLEGVPER